MAYEDWTTWDENDSAGELTVAANTITVTAEDVTGACVDKLYGTNYFSGAFTHYIDYIVSSVTGSPTGGIWAISDIDDWAYDNLGSGGLCIYCYVGSDLYIESAAAYDSTEAVSINTRYYLKIVRDGSNNVSCYVYSDASHTTLVDTIGPVSYSDACDYMSVAWNDYGGTWTGAVYNLDVGTVVAERQPFPPAAYNELMVY